MSKYNHDLPRVSRFMSLLSHLYFKLTGWRVGGTVPQGKKFLLVGVHLSNWDFPAALATTGVVGFKIKWLGKHTLFNFPFGGIMRRLGGIPVNRTASHGLVDQMVDYFNDNDSLAVVVAPSGTRSKTEYWKSGFYQIAYQANVPVLCSFIDHKNKCAGFHEALTLTGWVSKDMDKLRKYYVDFVAENENAVLPRLKIEDDYPDMHIDEIMILQQQKRDEKRNAA